MSIDKSNMLDVLNNFPKQCREALTFAAETSVKADYRKIAVCGMGGSGIGADILKAYMAESPVHVTAVKDYDIPGFVDKDTLVFAVSYSGNTEETLSSVKQAGERGAEIVAVTSGGELEKLCDTIIKVPPGLQPRCAVGYLFLPVLTVLANSGLVDSIDRETSEMLEIISDVEAFSRRGEEIASNINGRTTVILSTATMGPSAYRLKCQINENAEVPAYYHLFPEMCHNELVGFDGMDRESSVVLMMRDSHDHERNIKRMEICEKLFNKTVDVINIEPMGSSLLSRLFSMIYLGDWISYHMAMVRGVDPTPVHLIENLKQMLKD